MFELWIIIAGVVAITVYCNWPEKKQYVTRKSKKPKTQDVVNGWRRW